MQKTGNGTAIGNIVVAIVVLVVIIGFPVAVMTVPALRFLNPHAH